jgi:hypothetical protein
MLELSALRAIAKGVACDVNGRQATPTTRREHWRVDAIRHEKRTVARARGSDLANVTLTLTNIDRTYIGAPRRDDAVRQPPEGTGRGERFHAGLFPEPQRLGRLRFPDAAPRPALERFE